MEYHRGTKDHVSLSLFDLARVSYKLLAQVVWNRTFPVLTFLSLSLNSYAQLLAKNVIAPLLCGFCLRDRRILSREDETLYTEGKFLQLDTTANSLYVCHAFLEIRDVLLLRIYVYLDQPYVDKNKRINLRIKNYISNYNDENFSSS